MVIISAFLDLAKTISFSDSLLDVPVFVSSMNRKHRTGRSGVERLPVEHALVDQPPKSWDGKRKRERDLSFRNAVSNQPKTSGGENMKNIKKLLFVLAVGIAVTTLSFNCTKAPVTILATPSSMRLLRKATKFLRVFVCFESGVNRSGIMMVLTSPETIFGTMYWLIPCAVARARV